VGTRSNIFIYKFGAKYSNDESCECGHHTDQIMWVSGGYGPRIDYIVVCVNPERVTWLRGPKPPNLAQTGSGP